MSANVSSFTWNSVKLDAIQFLAEGKLTDEEIAARSNVTGRQLRRWKSHPEFVAKLKSTVEELESRIVDRGIARRANRVRALDDRWRRLQRVIDERGASPEMQSIPGGQTGFICRKLRGVGTGDNFQIVEEHEVDVVLLKELREHEKQAAQECGQWTEKRELSGQGGGPLTVVLNFHDLRKLPYDELVRLHRETIGRRLDN